MEDAHGREVAHHQECRGVRQMEGIEQLRLYRRGRGLLRQADGARGEGTPKPQP